MRTLSLRIRVFLFFCLIALGGVAIVFGGLWMGYRQLGDATALSAFITSALIAGFGFIGLAVFIWLLFDENVSKPIESLAAKLRVNAHTDVVSELDEDATKYLGDLGPAARALHGKLQSTAADSSETIAQQTDRLKRQRAQLLRILSDLPIAVIVAKADHQIVLYDGQAAEVMEREAPLRLNGSILDYLVPDAITQAIAQVTTTGKKRLPITVKGRSGFDYHGHIRVFDAGAGYTLMLEPLSTAAARPIVYDFDLFDKNQTSDVMETPLSDLDFVVFDSETTGLNPDTDEVVQLGAVRVVNGKLIAGEAFETLVNPRCPIPPHSTKVHGISDAMVADAPLFDEACKAFHGFSKGAVLVAHNAPFDLAFLHRQSSTDGYQFDQPVLDTVHLSAVVFGGAAEHTLDALCARLDITIPDEMRHTAMGDAHATACALVAMLPILRARGLDTFGQIKTEAQKHSRILKVQD